MGGTKPQRQGRAHELDGVSWLVSDGVCFCHARVFGVRASLSESMGCGVLRSRVTRCSAFARHLPSCEPGKLAVTCELSVPIPADARNTS